MAAGALRKDQNQEDDHPREDCGGQRPAPFEAAFGDRLVEEIADRCTERASEDEGRPEEEDAVHLPAREIENGEHQQARTEDERAAAVAEAPTAFADVVR